VGINSHLLPGPLVGFVQNHRENLGMEVLEYLPRSEFSRVERGHDDGHRLL
jgi:hypothetical protein